MTQRPATSPLQKKNGAQRPQWWTFAQSCIARLRDTETNIIDLERRAAAGDTAAVNTLAEYESGAGPKPPSHRDVSMNTSAAGLLGRATSAPHLPPEDWHAIVAEGGDPFATAADGSTRPAITLSLPELILLTRLAATFRDAEGFETCLKPGEITIIIGLEPSLGLGKLLTSAMLPEGWTSLSRPAKAASTPVLQLPDRAITGKELERSLYLNDPILLPVARRENVPELFALNDTGARVLRLAALSTDVLLLALSISHSATGRIDEESVRHALPGDKSLAELEPEQLAMACRAPTAKGVAERIAKLVTTTPSSAGKSQQNASTEIEGASPAHQAARNIVEDLAAWQRSDHDWNEMARSLLIYGAPGTGKTHLARQLAAVANVPLVDGSFASWQSAGHLGQMLAAMTKCFDTAFAKAPCILFIDEIDAAGSRFGGDQHGTNYRTQVVNGFLQQIDGWRIRPASF